MKRPHHVNVVIGHFHADGIGLRSATDISFRFAFSIIFQFETLAKSPKPQIERVERSSFSVLRADCQGFER